MDSGQCEVFGDLTEIYSDLTSDEGLVQFFNAVLARMDQLDQFLQTPDGGATTIVGANCIPRDAISQSRDSIQ